MNEIYLKESSKHGTDIVTDMIDLAKPKKAKREYVKIGDIINRVLRLQKKSLEFEQIKIEKNYNISDETFCDGGQLEQVLLNMIINARHAIIPKGKGTIKIDSYVDNDNLIFTIQDDGIGMDEDEKRKIFTPFFTTKGAFAKNNLGIQGNGLGLAVSYKIIESHNGSITVESEKNVGTKFIITLPITTQPPDSEKQIVTEIKEVNNLKIPNKILNILVIDDEQDILNILRDILEMNNCNVCISSKGSEGIELFRQLKFDLVFLDMLLPDLNGIEIFKEIKKINNKIPIVFLSGQIRLEIEKLKELGAYSFIQKPCDIKQIMQLLDEIRLKK